MLISEQYWADAATRNCVWVFQVREGEKCEGHSHWRTEAVFLTKREANEYGERRPYAWGKKGEGWRIWGVPCDGLMANFLGQHSKEFEKEVEYIGRC